MKNNNPGGSIGVVIGLIEEIAEKQNVLLAWIPKAFPLGMTVHWDHGDYVRSGVVDAHADWIGRVDELRVELKTGSFRWVGVTQLHEYRDAASEGQPSD